MSYTKELIDKVKELYPTHKEMHKLAESGDYFLGRYLDDSSLTSISLEFILKSNSLEDLKGIARKEKEKVDLYKEWCKQDPRIK